MNRFLLIVVLKLLMKDIIFSIVVLNPHIWQIKFTMWND